MNQWQPALLSKHRVNADAPIVVITHVITPWPTICLRRTIAAKTGEAVERTLALAAGAIAEADYAEWLPKNSKGA